MHRKSSSDDSKYYYGEASRDGWTKYTDPNGVKGTYGMVKNGQLKEIIRQEDLYAWLIKNR